MQFLFKAFKLTKVTDRGNSIAVDNNNCIYITGVTNIQRFPDTFYRCCGALHHR